jgi:hypothetical protein
MLILIGILVSLGPKIQIESIFNQKVQLMEIQTRKKNMKITTESFINAKLYRSTLIFILIWVVVVKSKVILSRGCLSKKSIISV